ncbi:MAG: redoxin domain-containing protein [Deltaproteobacteria bacterium]|nr:redoxin domain-containing protein [Deltaproteobacteria bacterium]
MPKEQKVGCARPTGGVVGETPPAESENKSAPAHEEVKPMVQVGKKAPDFMAPCFYQGKFASMQLSEYLGKWVVLCFYPGDFTFV